jgi:hypothetical protein
MIFFNRSSHHIIQEARMNSPQARNQKILAVIAILVGLFMVAVAPFLIQTSMERVVASLAEVAKEKPAYGSGVLLFSYLYPIWRGFIYVGGIALIVISPAIYKGKPWTFPAGQLASAFGAMGGMFMFLPHVSWVDGFPIPMVIAWMGLLYFWAAIFLRSVDKWEKWAHLAAMTFAGMLGTHAFVVGVGNLRMLLTRPGKPGYEGLEWYILSIVGPVSWLCVVLLITSIPLLAQKKELGWWLALICAVSLLVIDAPTQFIRTATLDYLYGSLISLGLLAALLFPRFKQALLPQE